MKNSLLNVITIGGIVSLGILAYKVPKEHAKEVFSFVLSTIKETVIAIASNN